MAVLEILKWGLDKPPWQMCSSSRHTHACVNTRVECCSIWDGGGATARNSEDHRFRQAGTGRLGKIRCVVTVGRQDGPGETLLIYFARVKVRP